MQAYEFHYKGLIFGADRDIGLTEVNGLDPPETRVTTVPRPGDHGSWVFAQFLSERTITFAGDVVANNHRTFQKRMEHIAGAFRPRTKDFPLRFRLPGRSRCFINCRPTRVHFPVDVSYGIGYGQWTAELVAEDPRIYEGQFNKVEYSDDDYKIVTNAGNFSTWPIVTFYGPLTNMKITRIDTGEFFRLEDDLGVDQSTIVNFQNRTIHAADGTNKYDTLDQDSTWWDLDPGKHKLHFQTEAGAGTAMFKWRNAWL